MLKSKVPEQIQLIGICDPHFSIHNPAPFKVDYWPVIRDSFEQILRYCDKNPVDAIVWAGDIFHLKTASRNPLHFIGEVMDLMREVHNRNMMNIGIAGNHDIKFGSLEGLTGQPLDLLIKAELYHLLDMSHVHYKGEDFSLRISGQSYHHGRAVDPKQLSRGIARYHLRVGHWWFGPKTGELFGEPIYGPDFFEDADVDALLIGHHHEDQGIHKHQGKTFIAAGALTRTGSHANDLVRKPAASLITITRDGIEVRVMRPKTPPATDIIDTQRRDQILSEKKELTAFLTTLKNADLTSSDPYAIIDEMDISTKVRNRVEIYLEEAEGELT